MHGFTFYRHLHKVSRRHTGCKVSLNEGLTKRGFPIKSYGFVMLILDLVIVAPFALTIEAYDKAGRIVAL